MVYNPAYSPEFNPIENVFSKLKTHFRKLEHTDVINDIKKSISTTKHLDFKKYYNHAEKIIKKFL